MIEMADLLTPSALMVWFPWFLTIIGVALLWLYGNKHKLAPLFGVFVQACLTYFAIATKQYGFISGALIYAVVHVRNYLEWRND